MSGGPLMIGLPGFELDDAGVRQIQHPAVGGVVLFSRNFRDPQQLDRLVRSIRNTGAPRPLICVDHEGGRVQRFRKGFTALPPLGVLGRLYESDARKAADMAYRHGRVMATEVLACGIDLSFAPVLDLDNGSSVIGDRSFSSHSGVVTELGTSYLAGMHDAGMRTTGKHFPGHGSVVADSHVDDVIDPRPLEAIRESDLEPFRVLAGQLDALMVAHIAYTQVDSVPAGYSGIWLKDILRVGMGYRGVVLSDDLGMHAAKTVGGLRDRLDKCLEAGCDLALVCQPEDVASLLPELDGPMPDATSGIRRLYGKPTVSREELEIVQREGIREWGYWRKSLEELGEQDWS